MQLTKINGKYELMLPEHRAAREQWDISTGGWEVKRMEEMINAIHDFNAKVAESDEDNPNSNCIVFDCGVEEGDLTAILKKYTACDLVMFEPNERAFGCIKDIWEGNKLKEPLRFFPGFLSNESSADSILYTEYSFKQVTGNIIPDHGFKQLYENYPDVPQITLDDYCRITGIYPDIITMDVEGSEQNVIRGAEKILREKKPIIFMSVHPEFMYESYRNEGIWKEKYGERQHVVHMLRFIDELGYKHECIEYDYHELHMRFDPC